MLVATARQFQKYDECVIHEDGQSIEKMILKAAKTLYPYVAREKNIVILAGRGNNGADGLALSCLLKNMEQNVTVFLMTEKNALSQGAVFYLEKALALNVSIYHLTEAMDFSRMKFDEKINEASVIIDGIFGTGLSSPPSGVERMVIHEVNEQKNAPVLAIDVPSGLNADNGMIYNEAIKAHLTVSFVAGKLGFLNPEAKKYTGEIHIEDLGYSAEFLKKSGFSIVLDPIMIEKKLKARRYDGFKGTYGTLACFVGSDIYPGAAVISCSAALRSGAGLVKVISSEKVTTHVINAYPEIVGTGNEQSTVNHLKNVSAILFGCGRGMNDMTAKELREILSISKVPTVIDADGINCLSKDVELLQMANCPIILTPHVGEMRRLLENIEEKDPVLGAIAFAKKYRTIIVLKGPHTLITDGKVVVRNPTGHKSMATAGMGDALAGIIASFLAQGYSYMDACVLGTYLHGAVASHLSSDHYSVFASDIINYLPQEMARIVNE